MHSETTFPKRQPPAPLSVGHALGMAYFSVVVLVVYIGAQSGLTLLFGRDNPPLKLVVEPYLLALGLVLHVHWRKITVAFREHGLVRPRWIATADCLSFMTTFWALWSLVEAFLQKAKLI